MAAPLSHAICIICCLFVSFLLAPVRDCCQTATITQCMVSATVVLPQREQKLRHVPVDLL